MQTLNDDSKKQHGFEKMMSGSGLFQYWTNYDAKQISLDVSGVDINNNCFRNDASILLLVANSYATVSRELLEKIEHCFQIKQSPKTIMRYAIPFMFNSRHFIELELKGIILRLDGKPASNTHDISVLVKDFGSSLRNYSYEKIDGKFFKEDTFVNGKEVAISVFEDLKQDITQYMINEPAVEFYRYIFEKDYSISETQIDFDYSEHSKLFFSIYSGFKRIVKELHCAGVTFFDA